jgi:membrane-associated protein
MVFPLPGDSLLFTTGIYSQIGLLNYTYVLFFSIISSTLGGHVGYFIGTKIDKETLINNRIYKIKDTHLARTEKFFEKYGFYAILFSRFVPIVRSFISQLMGIIKYDRHKFFWANLGASILWPGIITTAGYFFGKMFPNLITYSEYFMLAVIVALFYPIIHEFIKFRRNK